MRYAKRCSSVGPLEMTGADGVEGTLAAIGDELF